MKMLVSSILSLSATFTAVLFSCSLSIARSDSPEKIYNDRKMSVVKITVYNEFDQPLRNGSGVCIGLYVAQMESNGKTENIEFQVAKDIVSNFHVVVFGSKVIAESESGQKSECKVLYLDSTRDICVLRPVNEMGIKPALIATNCQIGEKVFALGNPRGLSFSFSDGIVSGFRTNDGVNLVQTTTPISQGSSGGGLFDTKGNLVGITTSQLNDAQNINFSILLRDLESILYGVQHCEPTKCADLEYDDWVVGEWRGANKEFPKWKEESSRWNRWLSLKATIGELDRAGLTEGIQKREAAMVTLSSAQRIMEKHVAVEFPNFLEGRLQYFPNPVDPTDESLYKRRLLDLKSEFGDVFQLEILNFKRAVISLGYGIGNGHGNQEQFKREIEEILSSMANRLPNRKSISSKRVRSDLQGVVNMLLSEATRHQIPVKSKIEEKGWKISLIHVDY